MQTQVAFSLDEHTLQQLDRLVAEAVFPSRSQAIQVAVEEKLARLEESRLARECAKLNPAFEKALAEEGLSEDVTEWPASAASESASERIAHRIGVMDINALLQKKREAILQLAAKHGAQNLRVFGSVARREADEQSDVDFLVDMEPGRSLLDMGGLLMDLRELLGREVDIVTERGLKPRIREKVLKEAVAL